MRTVNPISAFCRILAAAFSMCAAECCGMETLSLDGLWDFSFSEGGVLAEATAEFTADGKMPVPGCFDMMPPWRMKRGVGSYRRTFSVWRDAPSACLVVKGMGLRARFWLDGREIGASSLAWSELEFPIGALAAGEHVLAVAIDNTPLSDDAELFRPNYDFLASGGFYHGVELSFDNRKLFVRTRDYTNGKVEIEAVNFRESDFDATLLFDGKNKVAAKFRNGRALVHVPDFKLWSPESPNLHTLTINKLATNDCALTTKFGIREFKCKGGRFLLNGEPVFLKGVGRHDSDYADGYATSRQSVWRDIMLIKGLGANIVRTAHYTPSEEFLSLCDEAGLLVWQEALGWGNGARQLANAKFAERQIEQARLMARKSINHPSVVIDSFLNECDSTSEKGRLLVRRIVDVLRTEDTGHLVTFACNRVDRDIANSETDFVAVNLYPAWHQAIGTATTHESLSDAVTNRFGAVAAKFREKYPDKPVVISETGCYSLYGERNEAAPQWSEDFQAEYLGCSVGYALESGDFQGAFVWQFADARTYFRGGSDIRTKPLGLNMAGLFDIHRREKLAAGKIRELFKGERR